KSAKVIVEELYSLIKDFADGSEQFDDFTVLLMKFNDDYQFTKTFYAENREIPKFRDFVFDTIRVKELDEFLMDDILLSCDEAATNIVMHSYKDSNAISPTFDCSINFTSTGIQILISDRGSVFDRSLVKNPSVDANMKGERKGGFGVFLMEKLMDKVTYSWKDGINYVLLEKEFTLSIDA
ncbi:MAG: ATP-binding protein, partial [Leptospira sp.]|nr:ATP-binding protein [Leptospira sp.]